MHKEREWGGGEEGGEEEEEEEEEEEGEKRPTKKEKVTYSDGSSEFKVTYSDGSVEFTATSTNLDNLAWRKNWGPVEPEDKAHTQFLRDSPLWVGADWSKRGG